jgi:hypothetical protein
MLAYLLSLSGVLSLLISFRVLGALLELKAAPSKQLRTMLWQSKLLYLGAALMSTVNFPEPPYITCYIFARRP